MSHATMTDVLDAVRTERREPPALSSTSTAGPGNRPKTGSKLEPDSAAKSRLRRVV